MLTIPSCQRIHDASSAHRILQTIATSCRCRVCTGSPPSPTSLPASPPASRTMHAVSAPSSPAYHPSATIMGPSYAQAAIIQQFPPVRITRANLVYSDPLAIEAAYGIVPTKRASTKRPNFIDKRINAEVMKAMTGGGGRL